MTVQERIQDAAEQDALIIGANESIDNIDELDTVVLAANIPPALNDDVAEAAEDTDVTVERVDVNNDELGSLCMKPFSASVVGIKE